MKAYILNSCIVALKNKACIEKTRNYNRDKANKEQLTIADNLDNTAENSFEQLGIHKRMNEMVDFSGGLLGI